VEAFHLQPGNRPGGHSGRSFGFDQTAIIEQIAAYVAIESGTREKDAVDNFGHRFRRDLEELGFEVAVRTQSACGNHLVATRAGGGRGRLLLIGHLDTVWPSGTLREWPFAVREGRAYGPGVGDMKGGLVLALHALAAIDRPGGVDLERVTWILTGDEEQGSATGRAIVEEHAAAHDWALVLEPGRPNGGFVVGRGGVGVAEITASGRTAHTTEIGAGASALGALAMAITALHGLQEPERRVLINVGLASGGEARQVVAGSATALADLRAPDLATARALSQELDSLDGAELVPGTRLALRHEWRRPPAPPTPGNRRLMRLLVDVARDLGVAEPPEAEVSAGGSDGNFTTIRGVPTLDALGPTSGRICSRDEYIELDSLVPRAALLAGLIMALADGRFEVADTSRDGEQAAAGAGGFE
jgi:glutamate carboxypeptidase